MTLSGSASPPPSATRRNQLFEEERVAVRPLDDARDHLGRRAVAEHGANEALGGTRRQPRQGHLLHLDPVPKFGNASRTSGRAKARTIKGWAARSRSARAR